MKKIAAIIFCILFTSMALSQQEYEEVVYLKNGSVIKGIIIEQIPDVSIKIQTKDGNIFVYQMEEIDRIAKEPIEPFDQTDDVITGGVAQHQIGLVVGMNFSTASVDPEPSVISFETGFRTGFAVGGILFLNLSPVIGIQIEPTYMQGGTTSEMKISSNLGPLIIENTIKANYLHVPVFLRVSVPPGPVKPYILAGAYVALLLGDARNEMDKATVDGVNVLPYIPEDQKDKDEELKSIDFGLNFGAGVTIPLGNINLFLQALYSLGLTDINDDDDGFFGVGDPPDITTSAIQIKAGVLFPLN